MANGTNATAIGKGATANNTDAIAIGTGAKASGNQSISIGVGNTVSGNYSGAFGDPSKVSGDGSYSIGNNNTITSSNTFVLGSGINRATDLITDLNGTVANSVYLGADTEVTKDYGFALKSDQTKGVTTTGGATGKVGNVKIGYGDQAMGYGLFAGSNSVGAVSVGASGSERRIQNVAAGLISAESTDAINGSQLFQIAEGLGNQVYNRSYFHVKTGKEDEDLGDPEHNLGNIYSSAGAEGWFSAAAGIDAGAKGDYAAAFGTAAKAHGKESVAVGHNAIVGTTADSAIALGNGANASIADR